MNTISQGIEPSRRSNSLDRIGPELHGPGVAPVEMQLAAGNTHQSSLKSAVLNLPVDKPRAARSGSHFACQLSRLPQGLRDTLVDFSRRQQTPLPTVLLSAFHVLLLRYSGQENIEMECSLVGLPTHNGGASNRHPFVLHSDLSGDPAFDFLLARIHADVSEKLAHHDSPLPPLVVAGNAGTNGENLPFQVSFSSVSLVSAANAAAPQLIADLPVDLHLEMAESEGELVLRFFYNADLFHADSIARMQENFRMLLEGIIADSSQKLSRLPLLTEDEKQQILVAWNQTACDYPREKCLHELVEAHVERTPHAVAASCGTQTLTYGELNARANRLGHRLRSSGVGPNVRVGICLTPSLDFAVAVLAVLKAGGSCLPLDPKYPQERLAYMMEDAQARVLITEKNALPGISTPGCEVILLAEQKQSLSAQSEANVDSNVKPGDIAYVIYTSGSTGKPRGVLLPHSGLVNYNWNMARLYDMKADDRVLQFCSISFDIAIEEMFIAWLSGAALVFKSQETPLAVPEFLAWAERERITVLDLPTAYWHEWVHHLAELNAPSPRDLRLVIVGGEKASAKAYAKWQSSVDDRVRWVNTYGPTEASIGATWSEPRWQADEIPDNLPIGRPVPNARVYLLDRNLNPVPVGVTGELHIGGAGVALGYLNRPELTAEKFIADPFVESGGRLYKTGDLARYLPSGEIEFLGRRDDQIKIRGFRVELGEIESALAKHPSVREVAVIAREAASGDKQLAAYLVAAQGTSVNITELRSYLQQQLPEYMVPSSFTVLQAMPLTPNGKINRRGLPEPQAGSAPLEAAATTTDALQLQLLKIWQEVLGKKAVGPKDNFFDLGGHSLLAARLMHRAGQALGKTLPLAILFEAPTVEQLAAVLRQNGWSRHWSSLVPIQPAGSQTPFFCVHGVGGNVIGFSELARLMAPDYPFYGLQSQGLDGKHANHARIEDMAAHYLDEIRTVQPQGPYLFGGFSFGGLVAYEMAQQLRARGEGVSLLVLFDTYPGNLDPVASSLVKLMLQPKRENLMRDLTRAARKRIKRTFKGLMIPRLLKNVRNTNRMAADRYVLGPYAGKATLIRATEKSLRTFSDPHAAWKGLVAQLEIHDIPSDHYGILVEPQVRDLAQCLKGCIDQARTAYEQSGVALQAS